VIVVTEGREAVTLRAETADALVVLEFVRRKTAV
jgi:hypothetical protein